MWLQNLSETNLTLLNNQIFAEETRVKNGDVFTICDRSFRYEEPVAPGKTDSLAAAADVPAAPAAAAGLIAEQPVLVALRGSPAKVRRC